MVLENLVVVYLMIKGQSSLATEINKLVPPNRHMDVAVGPQIWSIRFTVGRKKDYF